MARKRTKYTLRKDGRLSCLTPSMASESISMGKPTKKSNKSVMTISVSAKSTQTRLLARAGHSKPSPLTGGSSANRACLQTPYAVTEQQRIALWTLSADQYVTDITGHQIVVFLQRFAARGYSQKVINNTKSVIRQILNHAFLCADIDANPCIGIPTPKGNPRVPRKPTPPDDLKKIEESKTESLFARMSYFMLYTGARRGEAAALKQKDIDLTTRTACVARAVAYSDTRKPVPKSPKTEAGVRYLDLPDNVVEILPHYDEPRDIHLLPGRLARQRRSWNPA